MKKLNFNVKKKVVISVLLVTSIALGISLIAYITKEHNTKDTQVLAKNNKISEVKVDDKKIVAEESSQDNVVSTNNETLNNETVPTKPEPPKEKPKTQDDMTNKNKVPTYTEKEVNPQSQTTPNAGEINSKGQTYFPGFGFVDNGGVNKGELVNSSGDINKQVGKMD